MNDEIMKEAVTSLFQTIYKENIEKTQEIVEEVIEKFKLSNIDISDPENFSLFISSRLNDSLQHLSSLLHDTPLDTIKDKYKTAFIYSNYRFLKSNIEELCVKREGSSCSADKSRWIIGNYLKYSLTEEIPDINTEEEHYWIPKFGSGEEWMLFCDGLYGLFYGHTEKYLNSYNTLLRQNLRTYKHILHKWFIEFKDGEIIQFDYTWDKSIDSPLNDCWAEKPTHYLIHRKHVGHRDYETHAESHKFFEDHFCKVPKNDINKIYKESEERFL